MPAPSVSVSTWRSAWLGAALVALATALAFAPAVSFEFVNWDDPRYVTGDPHVRAGLGLATVRYAFGRTHDNWHPLTTLSHAAVWQLAGAAPAAHHAVNVALHAANAALVVLALTALGADPVRAAIVAALFALHPLRVESVAWVTERKDVLSGLGFLATLWAYAAWVGRPSRAGMAALLAAFAFALLAKPMVVTTPFVLLLLDVWPLGRTEVPLARRIIEKWPLFLLAFVAGLATVAAQRSGGAMSSLAALPFDARLANAVVGPVRYLAMTIRPVDLAFFYPYRAWSPAVVLASAALLVGTTVAVLAVRGRRPVLAVGWIWWLVMLLPVSGLVQVGEQALADRYTYLPSLGLALALVWGVADAVAARPAWRTAALAATGAALVASTVLTTRQLATWRDAETLARHALAVTGDNHVAHLNLGQALVARGDMAGGRREYEAGVALAPAYPPLLVNLGLAELRDGQIARAEDRFRRALEIRPTFADALNGLGEVAVRRGDFGAAIDWYERALAVDPGHWNARANLADALAASGRVDDAIALYEPMLDAHPGFGFELGNLRFRRGDVPAALAAWRVALAARPDWHDVRDNVAVALLAEGQANEALVELDRVVAADPAHQRAHYHRGVALASLGRRDEARAAFARAVALDPADAAAKAALANLDGGG